MSAEAEGQGTKDTDEILGDARGPTQGYAYGALIPLALQAVETDKSFESKLASRLIAAGESA